MAKKISPFGVDMIKTCTAFGLTLGLQIYIIGVLAGGWLDRKLDMAPAFTIIGILVAVFISFYRLISDFKKALEQEEKRDAVRLAAEKLNQKTYYDNIFAEDIAEENTAQNENDITDPDAEIK